MSDTYVIVGAGPVGRATAQQLRDLGREVVVVTRSGSKPEIDGVRRVAADASDATALTAVTGGAVALFNCANPANYTVWDQVWPPLAASLLETAERTGAALVTASSLYGYGPVTVPMVEGMPDLATDHKGRLRADMWAEAKARHEAGRIHAVEVRASDYLGPQIGANGHVPRHVAAAKAGKAAWVIGSPDLPHTWTDVRDVARTLVAVADRPESWGRVWHAPSNAPKTQRQALTDVLASVGKPPVAVRSYPRVVTALGNRFVPIMRELDEMSYMFKRPYVMESEITQRELDLAPTPWDEVCRRTADGN
ncbi:MAG: NAD-dependent epimerase/dehydratase family protein [Propionibacteriaceae bacterium]